MTDQGPPGAGPGPRTGPLKSPPVADPAAPATYYFVPAAELPAIAGFVALVCQAEQDFYRLPKDEVLAFSKQALMGLLHLQQAVRGLRAAGLAPQRDMGPGPEEIDEPGPDEWRPAR